jgi:hypothetical protein
MFIKILESLKAKLQVGVGTYDYADVLGKSMLFYEAQQSGYIKSNGNRLEI